MKWPQTDSTGEDEGIRGTSNALATVDSDVHFHPLFSVKADGPAAIRMPLSNEIKYNSKGESVFSWITPSTPLYPFVISILFPMSTMLMLPL